MRAGYCIVFLTLILAGCYYDSEEFLFPEINQGACDTSNVTFSGTIVPVLESLCYRCHSNANSALGLGIKLEDYSDVKLRADDGSLVGSISHEAGYAPMPEGGSKVDECTIASFALWIESGALEN